MSHPSFGGAWIGTAMLKQPFSPTFSVNEVSTIEFSKKTPMYICIAVVNYACFFQSGILSNINLYLLVSMSSLSIYNLWLPGYMTPKEIFCSKILFEMR